MNAPFKKGFSEATAEKNSHFLRSDEEIKQPFNKQRWQLPLFITRMALLVISYPETPPTPTNSMAALSVARATRPFFTLQHWFLYHMGRQNPKRQNLRGSLGGAEL